MPETPIPSPFKDEAKTRQDLIDDVAVIRQKYGFSQVYFLFATPTGDGDSEMWDSVQNVASEGMVKVLQDEVNRIGMMIALLKKKG